MSPSLVLCAQPTLKKLLTNSLIYQPCDRQVHPLKKRFYLFIFREREGKWGRNRGRETPMWGRNIDWWPLLWAPTGNQTQACAPTGNRTSDLSPCGTKPNQPIHDPHQSGRQIYLDVNTQPQYGWFQRKLNTVQCLQATRELNVWVCPNPVTEQVTLTCWPRILENVTDQKDHLHVRGELSPWTFSTYHGPRWY